MSRFASVAVTAIGILLLVLGIALALAGAYLISLGGSWFYLFAGVAMAGVGYGLVAKKRFTVWLALGLFAASVIWALWEVGLDFWQLFPRVVVFTVIALIVTLATPLLGAKPVLNKAPRLALTAALAVVFLGFIVGMFQPHASVNPSGNIAQVIKPDASADTGNDWQQYGRTKSGTRYAPYDQINKNNVKDLKVAWTYRTGDMAYDEAEFQSTPIKVGDTVYICTPHNIIAAVDAETGQERWKFDPKATSLHWQRCRGLAYAETPAVSADPATPVPQGDYCARRIVLTTNDARLLTVNADTGKVCSDFGNQGAVDLLTHLGPAAPNSYRPTSAPLVADNVIVVGGMINDNAKTGEPSGAVRAYDVRTGAQVWTWEAANPTRGTKPLAEGEVLTPETPNVWGTLAYDPKLKLVYLPTGNQTPDFWGGNRLPGSEEYAASIVAVDVATGVDKWHFRTANHDLWDLDVAAQPLLYDRPNADGSVTPLVVQLTKRGQVFVLDRRDGKPVFDVTYRPVPKGAPAGDWTAPTQPFSKISLGTETLKESDMWGGTIFDQLYCRIAFKRMRYEGEFTPSNTDTSLIFPGYYGGMNWGGGAINEATGTLIVNDMRMAQWSRLIPQAQAPDIPYQPHGQYNPQKGTPYGALGAMFMSPIGIPCFRPPYGSMSAVDLTTGQVRWRVPLGTIKDSKVLGVTAGLPIPVGMPPMGGPMTTKGGVSFFAGTQDLYLRALDNDSGKELWRARLPVASQAAPMSYISDKNGKQYVVVTAGGQTRTGSNEHRGDYVIAYSLP